MQGIYNYVLETNCFYGVQCCSYSIVTINGTCNVIFHLECFVLSEVCVQCPIWLFSVVPCFIVFPVGC